MADNSDITYQIYNTLVQLQEQQKRNGTIAKTDIIDISEKDFIQGLQQDVFYHTKGVLDNDAIDNVYKGILKKINSIKDIREVTFESKIKLPNNLIKECVTDELKRQKEQIHFDSKTTGEIIVAEGILLYEQFIQLKNVEDRMAYYESLSSDEQREFREKLFETAFGKETGRQIAEAENQKEDLMKSEIFRNASKDEQGKAIKTLNRYNPLNYMFENLGLDFQKLESPIDRIEFADMFSCIHSLKSKSNDSILRIERVLQEYKPFLQKLGITDIKKFAEQFYGEIENSKQATALNELIIRNKAQIQDAEPQVREMLISALGEDVVNDMDIKHIKSIFLTTISENGEIDAIVATQNMQLYAKNKNLSFDENEFYQTIHKQREILLKTNKGKDYTIDTLKHLKVEDLDGVDDAKLNLQSVSDFPITNGGDMTAFISAGMEELDLPFEQDSSITNGGGMDDFIFAGMEELDLPPEKDSPITNDGDMGDFILAGMKELDLLESSTPIRDGDIKNFFEWNSEILDASAIVVKDEEIVDIPNESSNIEVIVITPDAIAQTATALAGQRRITTDKLTGLIPELVRTRSHEGPTVDDTGNDLNQDI